MWRGQHIRSMLGHRKFSKRLRARMHSNVELALNCLSISSAVRFQHWNLSTIGGQVGVLLSQLEKTQSKAEAVHSNWKVRGTPQNRFREATRPRVPFRQRLPRVDTTMRDLEMRSLSYTRLMCSQKRVSLLLQRRWSDCTTLKLN
jgi:hypothetical protein